MPNQKNINNGKSPDLVSTYFYTFPVSQWLL